MSARESALSPALEAVLREVCAQEHVPARRHDELRTLVAAPPDTWPVCCRGSCDSCVDEQTAIARTILARLRERTRAVGGG